MVGEINGVATAGNNSPIPGPSPNRGRVPKFPGFVGNTKTKYFVQQNSTNPGQMKPPRELVYAIAQFFKKSFLWLARLTGWLLPVITTQKYKTPATNIPVLCTLHKSTERWCYKYFAALPLVQTKDVNDINVVNTLS